MIFLWRSQNPHLLPLRKGIKSGVLVESGVPLDCTTLVKEYAAVFEAAFAPLPTGVPLALTAAQAIQTASNPQQPSGRVIFSGSPFTSNSARIITCPRPLRGRALSKVMSSCLCKSAEGQQRSEWRKRLWTRDAQRRKEAMDLIMRGELHTGADFEEASVIFQHGLNTDDYRMCGTCGPGARTLDDLRLISYKGTRTLSDRSTAIVDGRQRRGGQHYIQSAVPGGNCRYQPRYAATNDKYIGVKFLVRLASPARDKNVVERGSPAPRSPV
jgi:hypothetical protein